MKNRASLYHDDLALMKETQQLLKIKGALQRHSSRIEFVKVS